LAERTDAKVATASTSVPPAVAQAAIVAGADALGFVFYERSTRHMTIPACAEILKQISKAVIRVGVFVNATKTKVALAAGECGLNLLQFHGNENQEFCTQFGLMSMKAFRIRDAESLKELPKFNTDAWLLDAFSTEAEGGTGEKFNWDLAVEAKKFGRPFFLAGGLTPENVRHAIDEVRPWAVDSARSTELEPGVKDHEKVRAWVRAAR